jgi:hypothetical protein
MKSRLRQEQLGRIFGWGDRFSQRGNGGVAFKVVLNFLTATGSGEKFF